jgi:hypothetical protein
MPTPDTIAAGTFSSSLFTFTTTLPDDGTDLGGGWQEAQATLSFVDARHLIPNGWICNLTVGMPMRTANQGVITAAKAASMTAAAATTASATVMHSQPSWRQATYCPAFARELVAVLKTRYPGIGARASAR